MALLGVPVVGFVVGKVIHTFVWVVFLLQIPITAAHQAGQHGASGFGRVSRLETRTKESSLYASQRVINLEAK